MTSLSDRIRRAAKWNFQYGVGCGEMENKRLRPLLDMIPVLVEALARQSHPHIESFCKERAKDAIAYLEARLAEIEGGK